MERMGFEIGPAQVVALTYMEAPPSRRPRRRKQPIKIRLEFIQIKHRLLDRKITIAEIARRAGVSRTLVSLMFKGERKGYRHRAKIAKALGMTMEQLFNGQAKKRRPA